jgi:hypothetical protein
MTRNFIIVIIFIIIAMLIYTYTANPESDNYIIILGIIIIGLVIYKMTNKQQENFDLLIGDQINNVMRAVNMSDFFDFVEYFQTANYDNMAYVGYNNGEIIRISNNIQEILRILDQIVNKERNGFYHRYLMGLSNKIPLEPGYRSVYNYSTEQTIEVNVVVLRNLLDRVQSDNISEFSGIYLPLELPAFRSEFYIPLGFVIQSMLSMMNSDLFREYMHNQKLNSAFH